MLRTKPSNIVLTPSGQPIIGHNLVLDAPPLTPQEMPSILDAWLKNQFLSFVNSVGCSMVSALENTA